MAINKMTGRRYFSIGGLFVGRSPINTLQTVALTANGALTLDASKGDTIVATLTANATSMVINNLSLGQKLKVGIVQGAGGTHTVAWPASAKFAGGTAPVTSTVAGYTDFVTFVYDGTNLQEVSRSVGNH
jgi:hypothetical protein